MNKKAFTLVELLIVMAILAILMVMMIGILNPIAMVNRGGDAQRKKDVARIKVAFEEYFNDKGCYPNTFDFNAMNCGSNEFAPWIPSWLCDPGGSKYKIVFEDTVCPHWFKIYANLRYQQDKDIPSDWYRRGESFFVGDGTFGINDVNYGISSTNVNWYDQTFDPTCDWHVNDHRLDKCGVLTNGSCHGATDNTCTSSGSGDNCYADLNCRATCRVDCCGIDCN